MDRLTLSYPSRRAVRFGPWGDPNKISAMCWDDRHHRCTGWMVVPGQNRTARSPGLSIRCECWSCNHAPVPKDRHLHEPPQKGIPWSSSTPTQ